MLIVKMPGMSQGNLGGTSLRCPACGHRGTFDPCGQDLTFNNFSVGIRRCPTKDCRAIVFVVWSGGEVVDAYPPQRIDFDSGGIPTRVVKALEEAITCHATQCYTAAAIMVRKTLELLCDVQEVTGDNLKKRIEGLRGKILLSRDLLEGLNELRILGNDAAHVEAKEYDDIGKDEVEIGIDVAKEVLKAVYQHSNLVSRLRRLKKPQSQ